MTIAGIDIGYGYTKICTSEGTTAIFQTAISRYIPEGILNNVEVVKVNDEAFVVGEEASREGIGLLSTRRSDFVGSSEYMAVLGYSIKTAGEPECVVLGLPPGQFKKETIEKLKSKIKTAHIEINDRYINTERKILMIPQGAGIFFWYIGNGNSHDYRKNVAVVDIGYYTTDMVMFSGGKYLEGSARSYPSGIYTIKEQIKKDFYGKYGIFLKTDRSIKSLMENSEINIMGQKYVLDVRKILEYYFRQALSAVKEYLEGVPVEVDLVILGGGGANLMRKGFENMLSIRVETVRYPQIANAMGYLEYGKHYIKKLDSRV